MKKLQRIKLINWHLFTNNTIDFQGNVLISGDNGSGKSTLVDAIHFVLSGGLARSKFNMASANAVKGGRRTVETYMRARIGAVNQEFLRDESDILTHIALEFYDDVTDSLFTLGTVLQITGGILLTPFKFYTLDNGFNDELFFEATGENKKRIRNFDALKAEAERQGITFTALESPTFSGSYNMVRKVLDLPDEYETLLSNAICFDPNADLLAFTNDFLLEKKDVSLDEVKKAAKAYQDIAQLLQKEEEKAKFLAPLQDLYNDYLKAGRNEKEVAYLNLKNDVDNLEKDHKNSDEKLKDLDEKLAANEKNRLSTREEILKLEQQKEAIENNSQYGEIAKIEREQETLQARRERVEIELQEYNEMARGLLDASKKLGFKTSLKEALETKKEEALRKALNSYQTNYSVKRKEILTSYDTKNKEHDALVTNLQDLSQMIQTLESHQKAYPTEVKTFYSLLAERFALNEDFAMNSLSDLTEIIDEDYRDVIESILDKRRFDLFVAPQFFKEAAKLLEKHEDLSVHFGAGIVNTLALEDGIYKVQNSLADKIKALTSISMEEELPTVRLYLDFLLGDIACVDTPDFESGAKWVTKDGLYYDGVSLHHLNTKDLVHYIGTDVINKRLTNAKERYDLLSEKLRKNEEELQVLNDQVANGLSIDVTPLRRLYHVWSEENDIDNEIAENEERLVALRNSLDDSDLTSSGDALQALEQKRNDLLNQSHLLSQEKDELGIEKGRLLLNQENIRSSLKMAQDKLLGFLKENPDPLLKEEANKLLLDVKPSDWNEFLASKESEAEKTLKDNERQILKIMASYNERFNQTDVDPVIENINEYLQRYLKIKNDSLVAGKAKAEQAAKQAINNFKSGFLIGLRSNIQAATDLIARLNKVLKKHPFGATGAIYRFVIKPTNDSELKKIYQIAVETNEDYFENDLFTDLLSEENRSTMDYLFRILSNENPAESSSDTIEKFCDYRNYLSYDIIETDEDGTEKRYSDNLRSRSGGEMQTPFYVLIAASFDSAFATKKNNGQSPCEIVMLDEAFNNMDSDRIEDMMEFFRALNIQLVVSVPTSRFNYLADHIDTALVLVNNSNRLTAYQGKREN